MKKSRKPRKQTPKSRWLITKTGTRQRYRIRDRPLRSNYSYSKTKRAWVRKPTKEPMHTYEVQVTMIETPQPGGPAPKKVAGAIVKVRARDEDEAMKKAVDKLAKKAATSKDPQVRNGIGTLLTEESQLLYGIEEVEHDEKQTKIEDYWWY